MTEPITAVPVGASGSFDTGSFGGITNIPDQIFNYITGLLSNVFGSSDLQDNWSLILHTFLKVLGAVIALHP